MQKGKIYHDKDLGYIKYIGKRKVGTLLKDTFETLGKYKSRIYLHKKELGELTEYTGKAIYTLSPSGKNNILITKNNSSSALYYRCICTHKQNTDSQGVYLKKIIIMAFLELRLVTIYLLVV